MEVTTFLVVGGLIGLFSNGIIIGVGVGALVFIAYNFEALIEAGFRNG